MPRVGIVQPLQYPHRATSSSKCENEVLAPEFLFGQELSLLGVGNGPIRAQAEDEPAVQGPGVRASHLPRTRSQRFKTRGGLDREERKGEGGRERPRGTTPGPQSLQQHLLNTQLLCVSGFLPP